MRSMHLLPWFIYPRTYGQRLGSQTKEQRSTRNDACWNERTQQYNTQQYNHSYSHSLFVLITLWVITDNSLQAVPNRNIQSVVATATVSYHPQSSSLCSNKREITSQTKFSNKDISTPNYWWDHKKKYIIEVPELLQCHLP